MVSMLDLSFVVPAHNEEAVLKHTLEAIHSAAGSVLSPRNESYEIVVCDDASRDATVEVAQSAGARVVSIEARLIAAARNAGAAASEGRILVFVDADTTLEAEVLQAAVEALDAGAIGGGALTKLDGPIPWHVRLFAFLIVRTMQVLSWASGCFVFCRREDFEAVGGFDETLYATEELALSRALKKRGKFRILPLTIESSGRKARTHTFRELFTAGLRAGKGRRGLGQREGLEVWYGERRPDPLDRRHRS